MANILHISRTMDIGGAEKIVYQLATDLKEEFENVHVASTGGLWEEELNKNGIKHHKILDVESKSPKTLATNFNTLRKIIKENKIEIGRVTLNKDSKELILDNTSRVKLTLTEYKILDLLMSNKGRVFSSEQIYRNVWGEDAINTDTIMVHIRRIREKIEINPKKPEYLKVVWGIGYKFEKV